MAISHCLFKAAVNKSLFCSPPPASRTSPLPSSSTCCGSQRRASLLQSQSPHLSSSQGTAAAPFPHTSTQEVPLPPACNIRPTITHRAQCMLRHNMRCTCACMYIQLYCIYMYIAYTCTIDALNLCDPQK